LHGVICLLIRLTVCVWYLEPDNKKKIIGAGIGGGLKKGMQPELPNMYFITKAQNHNICCWQMNCC
jgi:hypothetical protein